MNRIVGLILSAMIVSLSVPYIPVNRQEYVEFNTNKTQKIQIKLEPQMYYEPIADTVVDKGIKNYESILAEEIAIKMKEIEMLSDKKEWFLAYKSIIEEYQDYFAPPETIYDFFSDEELDLLFHVVQAEIGDSNSFEQKVNVANVIFNRLEHEKFPDKLGEVLSIDQFASISDGRYREVEASEDTILSCEYAFQIEDLTDGCLFFDSNNALKYEFVFSDGAHNFYTLKNK